MSKFTLIDKNEFNSLSSKLQKFQHQYAYRLAESQLSSRLISDLLDTVKNKIQVGERSDNENKKVLIEEIEKVLSKYSKVDFKTVEETIVEKTEEIVSDKEESKEIEETIVEKEKTEEIEEPETITHIVSKEDIDNNPGTDLVEGETIVIEESLTEEDLEESDKNDSDLEELEKASNEEEE
ncbi:gp108 [Sphingomonas phage PAU]|uniref:gp108 n=1 Tax=Sphingomonas phage PAU TaxID=1150991 RepID=UPI000257325F|nr:gp108 [Sphingomonas phage PAU]AFF28106.1 gp108 [Sphingomonas phage PAU]